MGVAFQGNRESATQPQVRDLQEPFLFIDKEILRLQVSVSGTVKSILKI